MAELKTHEAKVGSSLERIQRRTAGTYGFKSSGSTS